MTPSLTPSELLDWYDRSRRDLPWRDPDVTPWQIMVSEFMLQQTPVSRVEPIWRDWVARWPTASSTAAASAGRRCARLGQARLPEAGQTPARMRDRHRARSRRRGSRRRRGPADAAGRRQLHRPRDGVLRLSAVGAGGGHQRATGGGPRGARPGRRRLGLRGPRPRRRRRRCCPKIQQRTRFPQR